MQSWNKNYFISRRSSVLSQGIYWKTVESAKIWGIVRGFSKTAKISVASICIRKVGYHVLNIHLLKGPSRLIKQAIQLPVVHHWITKSKTTNLAKQKVQMNPWYYLEHLLRSQARLWNSVLLWWYTWLLRSKSDLEKHLYSKREENLNQPFSLYVGGLLASEFTEMLV